MHRNVLFFFSRVMLIDCQSCINHVRKIRPADEFDDIDSLTFDGKKYSRERAEQRRQKGNTERGVE